jgi:hypothetical protein
MRKASALVIRLVAIAAGGFTAAMASGPANAQPAPSKPAPKYKSQPLNLQRQQLGSAGLPDAARARMRSGDCAGALDVFDAALETLKDPTLHRDRGLCHEKLGHVYPAIEDFRAYLTEAPDAADAAGITARLRSLKEQAGGRDESFTTDEDDDTPPGLGDESKATKKGTKEPVKPAARSDKVDYVSPEEDALRTSLRAGKGISVAPLVAVHKWLFQGATFGDRGTWSESLGIQVRDSFGPSGALVMELGYEHFNSTSIDPATISGLTAQVAYEFRFPFDPDYDNQFLLAPGIGYEHLGFSYTDGSTPSVTKGAFVPRVRLGWRHMLQPSTAFDLSLDFGAGNFFSYGNFPYDSNAPLTALVAVDASVAWGL